MNHLNGQRWQTAFLDFAIVVVGIFVGLQVTEWNEERKRQGELQVYYHRLVNELKINLAGTQKAVIFYETVLDYANLVLIEIDKPLDQINKNIVAYAYQASQRYATPLPNYTIEEMLSSGILSSVNDKYLKDFLNIHAVAGKSTESFLTPLTEYRINIRGLITTSFQHKIKKQCGDRRPKRSTNMITEYLGANLPKTCNIEFDEQSLIEQIKVLKSYKNLKKDLTYRINDIEWKISNYKNKADGSQLLLHYIETNSYR